MAEGWRCPGCGRFYAPHVDQCRKCEPGAAPVAMARRPTVLALWDEYAIVAPQRLSKSTWRVRATYRESFAAMPLPLDGGESGPLGSLPWDQCTPRAAELYRMVRSQQDNGRKGTVAAGTINRELGALQAMFTYHVEIKKTIPVNPLRGWERVDETPFARQTYMPPAQVRKYLEAGPPVFQDIGLVAWRCAGMRNAEARGLKKSEVDFASKVINLPSARNKSKRARVIPFPSDVEAILRRHCEYSRGPYVFTNPKDPDRCKPVAANTFYDWMKAARERSGVQGFDGEQIVFHHIRHAAVTDLLQDRVDPTSVMAAAGMTPRTLMRYSKFGPEQQATLRAHMESKLQPPAADRAGPRRAVFSRPSRLARR